MLVIDNLTVRLAGRNILKDASASLPAGRRVGLVGRNGAGKTTLLRAILGQIAPDSGEIVTHPRAGASAPWLRKRRPASRT